MYAIKDRHLVKTILNNLKYSEGNSKMSLIMCSNWQKCMNDPLIPVYFSADNLSLLYDKIDKFDIRIKNTLIDDTLYNLLSYILDIETLYNFITKLDSTYLKIFTRFASNIFLNMYIYSHNNNAIVNKIDGIVNFLDKLRSLFISYDIDVFDELRTNSNTNSKYIDAYKRIINISDDTNNLINNIRILIEYSNEDIQKIRTFTMSLSLLTVNQLAYLLSMSTNDSIMMYKHIEIINRSHIDYIKKLSQHDNNVVKHRDIKRLLNCDEELEPMPNESSNESSNESVKNGKRTISTESSTQVKRRAIDGKSEDEQ